MVAQKKVLIAFAVFLLKVQSSFLCASFKMSGNKENFEITKLDGKNFPLWQFSVKFALEAKGLTSYIGKIAEPVKEKEGKVTPEWEKWTKDKSRAAVLLLSSVEKGLHADLINCSGSQEIWEKLKSLYGQAKRIIG